MELQQLELGHFSRCDWKRGPLDFTPKSSTKDNESRRRSSYFVHGCSWAWDDGGEVVMLGLGVSAAEMHNTAWLRLREDLIEPHR